MLTDINAPSPERIAQKIKMSLDTDHLRVGILVESHKDEIIFRKFFDAKKCHFYPQNGKYKLLPVLEILNKSIKDKVIGIIDADFHRILGTEIEYENLFLTDKHDVELMMMFSEAWQNMINHYVNPEKIAQLEKEKKDTLLHILLHIAFPLSCLRWLREDKKLENIKFRRSTNKEIKYLKYQDFIDDKSLTINKQNLIRAVENISEQPYFFAKNNQYLSDWETYLSQKYDLGEFSNGHDILHILSIALQKVISNRANTGKIEADTLAENLGIAYRLTDFQHTQLYQSLSSWQKEKALSIFKDS